MQSGHFQCGPGGNPHRIQQKPKSTFRDSHQIQHIQIPFRQAGNNPVLTFINKLATMPSITRYAWKIEK